MGQEKIDDQLDIGSKSTKKMAEIRPDLNEASNLANAVGLDRPIKPKICGKLNYAKVRTDVRQSLKALVVFAITALTGLAGEGHAKEPVIVGDAQMLDDGTIIINMRRTADGINISGVVKYPIDDPHYKEVLDHIGGMHPGEVKLVPAWDDPAPKKR